MKSNYKLFIIYDFTTEFNKKFIKNGYIKWMNLSYMMITLHHYIQ